MNHFLETAFDTAIVIIVVLGLLLSLIFLISKIKNNVYDMDILKTSFNNYFEKLMNNEEYEEAKVVSGIIKELKKGIAPHYLKSLYSLKKRSKVVSKDGFNGNIMMEIEYHYEIKKRK